MKSGLRGFRVTLLHKVYGAGGRARTGTLFPKPDFESGASTNFTTPAGMIISLQTNYLLLYLKIGLIQIACLLFQ